MSFQGLKCVIGTVLRIPSNFLPIQVLRVIPSEANLGKGDAWELKHPPFHIFLLKITNT